jgi:hypothetical protein
MRFTRVLSPWVTTVRPFAACGGERRWARIAAVIVCLSLLASARTAVADLIFEFSFDNATGDTAGPIAGTIFGLVDNQSDQAATEIRLTSVGGHVVPFQLPLDILAGGWLPNPNSFSVLDRKITEWDAFFISPTNRESLDFGVTGQFESAFETNRGLPNERITQPLLDDIRFTANIPEPSSLALLSVFGLGLACWWRRRTGITQARRASEGEM